MKLSFSAPGGKEINPRLTNDSVLPQAGLPDFQSIISWASTILLISAVILTLFFLIWGGIEWITSGGNKEKLAGAQKKMIYAGIGLIISIGAFMIINIVGELFGITFFGK